jgi:hypothetical protein
MKVLWHLETIAILRVLDMEKIKGDYRVHLCNASEGAKDMLVCMLSC